MVEVHCAGIEVTKVGYGGSSLYRSSVVMLLTGAISLLLESAFEQIRILSVCVCVIIALCFSMYNFFCCVTISI